VDQTHEERTAREALIAAAKAEAKVEALERRLDDGMSRINDEVNHRFTQADKHREADNEDLKEKLDVIFTKLDGFNDQREKLYRWAITFLLGIVGYLVISGVPWGG